jgi:hypothetical protein
MWAGLAALLLVGLAGCQAFGAAQSAGRKVNGLRETIGRGEDAITVLYVWGKPYEMGYAHGALARGKIQELYSRVIEDFAKDIRVKVEDFDRAYAAMEPFISADYRQEMQGLADGAGVDVRTVHRVQALGDLGEYHCSFVAAFGSAVENNHLYQCRALDYAVGLGMEKYPAIIVYKPTHGNIFAEVGWLGYMGCVSGMSAKQIAVSEIGQNYGAKHETLHGIPMPFLLRNVLQKTDNLKDATKMIQQAHRTSSYYYCVGDGETRRAHGFRTAMDFCEVFGDDVPTPDDPGWRRLKNVIYRTMNDSKAFVVLKRAYGHIDQGTLIDMMRTVPTGNLHAVAYDVTAMKMWVANATTGAEPAYHENFVEFDLAAAVRRFPAAP